MKNPRPFIQIRSRKLGILMVDSRLHARRNQDECAEAMGVSSVEYQSFENGTASPSLPQIELLSIFLNVPLEHFWDQQALSTSEQPPHAGQNQHLLLLRNRVIGASLRMARKTKNLSPGELSEQTSLTVEQIERYEQGQSAIPLPELEVLAKVLDTPLSDFYDQHGPISKWRARPGSKPAQVDLPPELRDFVAKPVNRPYLDIALKLSGLPADKLRILAESLLEITY